MEYKFVRTSQGPALMGDDEVLFFNDFQALVDYFDTDPAFLVRAKNFIAEGLRETADSIATSMTTAVVGGDQTPAIYGFINASRMIREFEYQFLPAILGQKHHH